MVASTSRLAFSTISSMRTVMASGVSSMIRSTPVRVSSVRMLRPSRPMMRPFISSLGRGTTETVASATWSAAQRWMARERISRARVSASSLNWASISRTFMADSWVTSSASWSMR